MKKIERVIRPHLLEALTDALLQAGVSDLTVSEVKGVDRPKVARETPGRSEYGIAFLPQLKVEAVVTSERLAAATAALMTSATGDGIGEGPVLVCSVDDAVSIGTGRHGSAAL
jgi:nitrogen regulatory protein P-II 1